LKQGGEKAGDAQVEVKALSMQAVATIEKLDGAHIVRRGSLETR
jgi:hypothetical protein